MYCYTALPLDLHVLGLPLAFILSQDQTLRCIKFKMCLDINNLNLTFFRLCCFFTFNLSKNVSCDLYSPALLTRESALLFFPFPLNWERKGNYFFTLCKFSSNFF